MRSRASIKAHPIHPSLIPFPFAFLTGAVLFDIAALATGYGSLGATGSHLTLAGIVAGLLAAVPGAVDFFYTVPPNSSGKKRAAKHGTANVAALLLFGVSWWLRTELAQPTTVSLAVAALGAAFLIYAGYLGGTLVTRNMISVDHRYANAGKWQEMDVSGAAGQAVVVADAEDLKAGQMKLLHVNGKRIVLARTGDGYTAFDDGCTHRGGSLAGGVLIDATVHCLWHGSQFDVTTGKVTCGPAKKPIRAYEVRETRSGEVQLVLPPA